LETYHSRLLPSGETKQIRLTDVLYVPQLPCNLLSVAKAVDKKNAVSFSKDGCEIRNDQGEVLTMATKSSRLYHLEFYRPQQAHVAREKNQGKALV